MNPTDFPSDALDAIGGHPASMSEILLMIAAAAVLAIGYWFSER